MRGFPFWCGVDVDVPKEFDIVPKFLPGGTALLEVYLLALDQTGSAVEDV
jgi:hypothetical protein